MKTIFSGECHSCSERAYVLLSYFALKKDNRVGTLRCFDAFVRCSVSMESAKFEKPGQSKLFLSGAPDNLSLVNLPNDFFKP